MLRVSYLNNREEHVSIYISYKLKSHSIIKVLSIMFIDQNTISLEKMNNKETLKTDYYFLLPSETLETNGFIIEKFTHFYEFTGKSIEINSGDDF